MPWPLSQDYNEAIQDCAACFTDPELKQGEAVTNALGLPVPCSGNFADVYAVQSGQRKWAVKCFTRQVPGLQQRYVQISSYLKQLNLPFMVEFAFLEKGIRVRGDWYPVLKMQWVEGFQLNTFIKDNVDKPQILQNLCQIWVKLAARLCEGNLAHGDLQHGNVLLVPGIRAGMLSVRLVDYDGMCVPALEQLKSMEVGHPCYQHPARLRDGGYGLYIDRFAHLVIYTALRAVIAGGKPLWDRFDSGDNLLFRQKDFEAPAEAPVFPELQKLKDPEVPRLVEVLLRAAQGPLDRVPLLSDLLPKETPAPTAVTPAPVPPPTAPARPTMPMKPAPRSPLIEEEEDDDDMLRRRSKYRPRTGMNPWPIVAVGAGAAVLLVGLLTFFLMRSPSPPRTEVAEVQPVAVTTRRATERASTSVAPATRPATRPMTDPPPDPPPMPKPPEGALRVREYAWTAGSRPIALIPNADGFCVLGGIGGGLHGFGEQVGMQLMKDGRWVLFGQSAQGSLSASVFAVETSKRADFEMEIKEYSWQQKSAPVKMIPRQDGFCFLSFVAGNFLGGGEEVSVYVKDGYWYLGGRAASPIAARAVAVRAVKKGGFRAKIKEYTWKPASKPIKMIPRQDGFCFLTTVGGAFRGGTEFVKIRAGDEDCWYLEGQSNQASVVAKAMSVSLMAPGEESTDERLEVPDAEAQATAKKTIMEIYAKEFARTGAADRLALATKLLDQARNVKEDAVTRYVLLDQARSLAALAAKPRTALRTIDEMAKEFTVNIIEMKVAVLEVLAEKTVKPTDNQALVGHILAVVEDAVGMDNYDAATKLLKLAETAAKSTKIVSALNPVHERSKEVEALHKEFEKLGAAEEALTKDPTDAAASLLKGKYVCLVRGDWAKGLPLLTQGSDAKLKNLAVRDLKAPEEGIDQVALGDDWHDLAEAETGRPRAVLYRRAYHWYELALPKLGTVAQARIEKRIKAMIGHGVIPPRYELRITAFIDGKDEVRISATESRWIHFAPGAWPALVKINQIDWVPQKNGIVKNGGTNFLLRQQVDFSTAKMIVKRGRGKVDLQIGADYVAVVFDDSTEIGADTYQVIVSFEK